MARLKARVAKLDDVEESLRSFYREAKNPKGDVLGFVIDVEADPDGWDLQDVKALRGAYSAEKEARRLAAEELEGVRSTIQTHEQTIERLRKRKSSDEPDVQKAVEAAIAERDAEWATKFAEQGKLKDGEIDLRDREVYGFAVRSTALEALRDAGATDEGMNALPDRVEKRLRMRRDAERRLHVDVLDANGNPAIGATPTEPATLRHVIETEIKPVFPSLFKGTEQTGSGANQNRPRTTHAIRTRADFNGDTAAKAAFIHEHGREAYENLPAK